MSFEDEYKQSVRDLKEATDKVKKFAEDTTTELKNLGKVTEETKAAADKALADMNLLNARLTEMEQKASRRSGIGDHGEDRKSLGEAFVQSDEAKSLKSSFSGKVRVDIERKAITTGSDTVGTGTSGSTSLIPAMRLPSINMLRLQQPVLRDLIPAGQTSSPIVEYPFEKTFDNKAATVAETAKKPYSNITFDLKRANVATIAHLFKVSKQALDDAPELSSIINTRGIAGLRLVEDAQFMYGDGTGANILGLMKQAQAFAPPAGLVAPDADLDAIRMATLQASLSLYPASGIVLHEVDWYKITSQKDTIGRYLIGDPQANAARTLWGLPVVVTQRITQGTYLVGAFSDGAQIFDRQSITVEIDTTMDDFENNMVTARVEERTALVIYRQEAFVTGTLPSSAPAGG